MIKRHEGSDPDDAGIEELLREVGGRDEPAGVVMNEIRDAVHAEWQAMLGQRKRQRRTVQLGIAAGVACVAVVAGTIALRPDSAPATVANVVYVDGKVEAAGEHGAASRIVAGRDVLQGETLRTDGTSRARIEFGNGVSVRLDVDTAVRLADLQHIALQSGALYIEAPTNARDAQLAVQTTAGAVHHIGTRYEIRQEEKDRIAVSVREGRVEIASASGTNRGTAGERIHVTTAGNVQRSTVASSDPSWAWITHASEPFDINDQPLTSFLVWVARETGRELSYASDQAQAAAAQVKLRGSIAGLDPDVALQTVLSTTHLRRYPAEDTSIRIGLETPSTP